MAWYDRLIERRLRVTAQPAAAPPEGSYAATIPAAGEAYQELMQRPMTAESLIVKAMLERPARASAQSLGVPDLGFKGVRQQLFHRFNLVDLYAIAHNNSVIRSATLSLRQEVFRRGLRWEPTFAYRNRDTGEDYELEELEEIRKKDEAKHTQLMTILEEPDRAQRTRFEQLMARANIYDQSLMHLLRQLEDDLNIVDDAFLFLSSDYILGWGRNGEIIRRTVRQLFRLDPIFLEFDTDNDNRPGFAHHLCLLHRDDLLDIPQDAGWDVDWQGRCPRCGHTTFPVYYRYSPNRGTIGVTTGQQTKSKDSLYYVKGEVIHASKFSPSELYGYSPVLSIYEKALSLIGMDRYLYDYFFERQMPQGVVTTTTDNPAQLEAQKNRVLAEVLANPHYIPWLAVSSRTGQGKTEFVRFAYSLDELQFLPVQEHIERGVAALYGVPGLFMGDTEGVGGLNNESQQLTRMSRGAQSSQDVYNTDLLPMLLDAFGVTDWRLVLDRSEEQSEQFELDMRQRRAQHAQTMAAMGFGVKYDQDSDEFEFFGTIQSQEEQMEAQQGMYGGMGF